MLIRNVPGPREGTLPFQLPQGGYLTVARPASATHHDEPQVAASFAKTSHDLSCQQDVLARLDCADHQHVGLADAKAS